MRRRVTGAAAALAVAALLAAGAAPAGAGSTVKLRDNTFSVRSLTVAKGTAVTFVWAGRAPHNVTATGAARFASPTRVTGRLTKRFTKKGIVRIVCTVHPGMGMTVRVK